MRPLTIADGLDDAETALQEFREILILLALASAVIASPCTPPLTARVIAVMAQHTAMDWADLLSAETQDLGGAV